MKTVAASGLPERIHAVGVRGGGVGGLAEMLVSLGHVVTGSDASPDVDVEAFAAKGIAASSGPSPALVERAGLVVRSAAVPDHDADVETARRYDVPVWKYAEALGALTRRRPTIAVAGTHGKTTTSALVAHLLAANDVDAGWVIGGLPRTPDRRARWGSDDAPFVVEACEYDLSFLNLTPRSAILTGVVADHLDCFGDAAGVRAAFAQFVERLPDDGLLVAGRDVPDDVLAGCRAEVARVGRDVAIDDVVVDADGRRGVLRLGDESTPLRFEPVAEHNLDLLAASVAVARAAAPDVPLAALAEAAATYRTPRRRLEDLGDVALGDGRTLRVVDDFAHHPDSLVAARNGLAARFPGRRVVGVFEPHQVGRTADFFDDFVAALRAFDEVLLCDIFVARDAEPERQQPLTAALAEAVGAHCSRCGPARDVGRVLDTIRARAAHDDVVVFMGAGSIDGLARHAAREPARP